MLFARRRLARRSRAADLRGGSAGSLVPTFKHGSREFSAVRKLFENALVKSRRIICNGGPLHERFIACDSGITGLGKASIVRNANVTIVSLSIDFYHE